MNTKTTFNPLLAISLKNLLANQDILEADIVEAAKAIMDCPADSFRLVENAYSMDNAIILDNAMLLHIFSHGTEDSDFGSKSITEKICFMVDRFDVVNVQTPIFFSRENIERAVRRSEKMRYNGTKRLLNDIITFDRGERFTFERGEKFEF